MIGDGGVRKANLKFQTKRVVLAAIGAWLEIATIFLQRSEASVRRKLRKYRELSRPKARGRCDSKPITKGRVVNGMRLNA